MCLQTSSWRPTACTAPPTCLHCLFRFVPHFNASHFLLQTLSWRPTACTAPLTCSPPPCRLRWSAWRGEEALWLQSKQEERECMKDVGQEVQAAVPPPVERLPLPLWARLWIPLIRFARSVPPLPAFPHIPFYPPLLPPPLQQVPAAPCGGDHRHGGQGDRQRHAARRGERLGSLVAVGCSAWAASCTQKVTRVVAGTAALLGPQSSSCANAMVACIS